MASTKKPTNMGKEKLHCSFCGKEQDAVKRLVAGPGVYICDECISLCTEIIADEPAHYTRAKIRLAVPRKDLRLQEKLFPKDIPEEHRLSAGV